MKIDDIIEAITNADLENVRELVVSIDDLLLIRKELNNYKQCKKEVEKLTNTVNNHLDTIISLRTSIDVLKNRNQYKRLDEYV